MELTHFDDRGNARMVDVGEKEITCREALARGNIFLGQQAFRAVRQGTAPKGDVLSVARVAGIMGAKRTAEMIPLCHILPLTGIEVDFLLDEEALRVEASCRVRTKARTGVEMEALQGVSTALLTIYDMLKSLDKEMEIGRIYLAEKTGGKSGSFRNEKRIEEGSRSL